MPTNIDWAKPKIDRPLNAVNGHQPTPNQILEI